MHHTFLLGFPSECAIHVISTHANHQGGIRWCRWRIWWWWWWRSISWPFGSQWWWRWQPSADSPSGSLLEARFLDFFYVATAPFVRLEIRGHRVKILDETVILEKVQSQYGLVWQYWWSLSLMTQVFSFSLFPTCWYTTRKALIALNQRISSHTW